MVNKDKMSVKMIVISVFIGLFIGIIVPLSLYNFPHNNNNNNNFKKINTVSATNTYHYQKLIIKKGKKLDFSSFIDKGWEIIKIGYGKNEISEEDEISIVLRGK